MRSNSVNVAEVDNLDDKVCHNLVEIVRPLKTTQWRINREVNIDQYDVEAAHREDSIVAQCRE